MLSERFDEWEAQFLRRGRREGRKDGAATLLTRQLRKRFGELPESVRTRVSEASSDELELWGERLLEASSLDDVFSIPLPPEDEHRVNQRCPTEPCAECQQEQRSTP